MTQQEVLEWVLKPEHDCYVYDTKMKEDGLYYYVRKNGTKKIATIYPVKNGVYTAFAVCHICQTLSDLPIPNYAKGHEDLVLSAKGQAKILEEFPKRNLN